VHDSLNYGYENQEVNLGEFAVRCSIKWSAILILNLHNLFWQDNVGKIQFRHVTNLIEVYEKMLTISNSSWGSFTNDVHLNFKYFVTEFPFSNHFNKMSSSTWIHLHDRHNLWTTPEMEKVENSTWQQNVNFIDLCKPLLTKHYRMH
jgi:hypothetical protein